MSWTIELPPQDEQGEGTAARSQRLARWYREPAPAMPKRIEIHLGAWLSMTPRQHEAETIAARIATEERLLNGARARYPHAGPEERQELERWAANAKASINNLTERLNQLRPPEARAA